MWPPKKYIIAPKYQCPDCGDLHDDNYDAEQCCPVHIHELYICPICDEDHMTEKEARDYAAVKEKELGMPVILPLEDGVAKLVPIFKDMIEKSIAQV